MKTPNGNLQTVNGYRAREEKETYTLKFRDMDSFPGRVTKEGIPNPERENPESRIPVYVGGILTIPKSDSYLILAPNVLASDH